MGEGKDSNSPSKRRRTIKVGEINLLNLEAGQRSDCLDPACADRGLFED